MQLTVQQPDLASMFGQDSLFNTLYGMRRQDQANANQTQNLGQAQQEQQFQADLHPAEVQQALANVGHTQALTGLTQAQTPGVAADSMMKQNAARIDSSIPDDVKRQAAITKIASGMSEDEAKQHQAQATTDLFATLPDGTPDIKKRQEAGMVLQSMPDIVAKIRETKQQGDNAARVASIEGGNQLALDKQQAAEGKFAKNTVDYLMYKGFSGNFPQQAGAWTMRAAQLEDQGDVAGAEKARQYADLARNASHDDKAAAAYTALAKSPDFMSLGITPAVSPSAVAPRVPTTTSPAAASVPGMAEPTDPTKSQMVPMKDKNGIPHLVPKANVQRALQGGWTQ